MDCTGIGIGIRSFCEGDASVRVISSCNRRRSTTLSDQLDWHFSSTTIFLLFLSRLSVNKVPSFFKSFLLQRISKGSRDKDCCLFHKMKTITRESIMLLKTLSPYVISVQVRRKVRRKFTRDSSRSFDFVRGKEKVNSRFDAISVKGISPLAPILRTQPTHIVTRDVVALCDTQIDRPNIAASNFRNVIKRFSRRGQYPTIRCSLRESLTFAPSLSIYLG